MPLARLDVQEAQSDRSSELPQDDRPAVCGPADWKILRRETLYRERRGPVGEADESIGFRVRRQEARAVRGYRVAQEGISKRAEAFRTRRPAVSVLDVDDVDPR